MTKTSISLDIDPTILENNMRIVKENPLEEELNNILSTMDTVPSKLVKPTPGFCVKTFTKPDNKKVFINVCITDAIPCPRDITNDELMEILSSDDPSNYRVPMSIGEGRTEQDKSGSPVTVYDIAINPKFFEKVEKDELFRTFFLTIACEGIQDKYQFEIDMQKFIVLKNRKSMGTLQSHRIQIRDIKTCDDSQKKPLIEEINTSKIPIKTAADKKEILYRLTRHPPTGEVNYILAELKVPSTVECQDLNLEVGEDRMVLDCKGLFDIIDMFLPYNVDQHLVDAELNRNDNMLTVKMPVKQ